MFSFLRLSSRPALPLRSAMPKAHSAQHSHRSASEAEAADITARILLETNSVLFRPEDPFTFTSGRKSPVYIDCRRLISFPRARTKLMDLGAELIERQAGGHIDHAFVIFNYGIFPQIETSLAAEGITLLALATWWDVAQTAERLGHFKPGQYEAVKSFLEDPEAWSRARTATARR